MSRVGTILRTPMMAGAVLSVALWTGAGVGLASTGEGPVAVGAWVGPDYHAGAGRFSPVSLTLLRGLLGPGGSSEPNGNGREGSRDPRQRSDGSQTGTIEPPPPPVDPKPDLRPSMTADRRTAEPGEEIEFTVVVFNVGNAPAKDVVIQAHIPAGTVQTGGSGCGELGLNTGGDGPIVCGNGNGLLETPDTDAHVTRALLTALPADGRHVWRYRVRVRRGIEPGTLLRNHAHASAENVSMVTSSEVVVRVT